MQLTTNTAVYAAYCYSTLWYGQTSRRKLSIAVEYHHCWGLYHSVVSSSPFLLPYIL